MIRWLGSKEVKEDFGQLRQLVLVEEFKSCVHADIKTHLDENATKIKNLHEAATMADDHGLNSEVEYNQFSVKTEVIHTSPATTKPNSW